MYEDEQAERLPFPANAGFSTRSVIAGAIVVAALAFALGLTVEAAREKYLYPPKFLRSKNLGGRIMA